ncbi:ribonuclease PH [Candidatus Dependentiae bacterium]|nr:ribonuclease PH [Candidatus Dependentiae bacterium]
MSIKFVRAGQRSYDQLRPLRVIYDVFKYSSGSTLFEMGNTKVLCSVTLQQGVPHFLRGKKTGWLTAEYSLLPASTPIRTVREVTANKRSGRTIEISRLIGRSLRSVVNLAALGEQTVFMDCDILQADGGTRIACITAAYLALRAAQTVWLEEGILLEPMITDELAAVSVGLCRETPLLDLDFIEDSGTEADFNFVLTRSGRVVEIQGSAERFPLTWDQYDHMKALAIKGVGELFSFYDKNIYELIRSDKIAAAFIRSTPSFSLYE